MRLVLKYSHQNNKIHVELTWRNTSFDLYIYLCRNKTNKLLSEVQLRSIKPDDPAALIPVTLIETPLQLIQGAIYYRIYSDRLTRIRNKGLLLASMILGVKQLGELIDKLEKEVGRGVDYYLVSVDTPLDAVNECSSINMEEVRSTSLSALVKNTQFVISMI